MLQMKPACETCAAPLAHDGARAFICSYECTFCEDCTRVVHAFACPNCGGELQPRPTRMPRETASS